jgi:hypothetical protein
LIRWIIACVIGRTAMPARLTDGTMPAMHQSMTRCSKNEAMPRFIDEHIDEQIIDHRWRD